MVAARLRHSLLAVGLMATLGAAWWVEGGAGDATPVDASAPRAAPASAPAAQAALSAAPVSGAGTAVSSRGPAAAAVATADGIDLTRLRRNARGAAANAFEVRSWEPPQRRPSARELREQQAAAPPPPPPQAPPLPFTYLGRLVDGATTTVFLSEGGRDLAVSTGATVGGRWRLDAVSDRAISFTYLPLGQRQSLSLGSP